MTWSRRARRDRGTVWLVADRLRGDYACYRYVGRNGDHLAESARQDTTAHALEWGRARAGRVRIRTTEARTYWAGTAPRPDGLSYSWPEPAADLSARAAPSVDGLVPKVPAGEGGDAPSL